MECEFIARGGKNILDVAPKIIKVETIKADEECIKDLQEVIELLKKLGYTIE